MTALKGGLQNSASLARAVDGVSAVVHLAAVFRRPDNDLIWKSSLDGTRYLIAAAKARTRDARFIVASTSNIYNKETPRPSREDDAADPKQAYPASKLAAEGELRTSGLNWSILRFGFVYGEGDGHVEPLTNHVAWGKAKFHPAARMTLPPSHVSLDAETMLPS